MNKGLDPINSMAIKISNVNYNNKWLFREEQVLSRPVLWLTLEIVLHAVRRMSLNSWALGCPGSRNMLF